MKVFFINFKNFENFTIFKNKHYLKIIITNKKKFFTVGADTNYSDCSVDKYTKSVFYNVRDNYENYFLFKNFNFFLKHIFVSFFFKIRFNGKGFRIQSFRNKKTMNFTFGYSHIYYVNLKKLNFKRLSKYKYFFKTNSLISLNFLKNIFRKIKPINAYTLRGLRISRTTIVKRKGRKSPNL